MTLTNEHSMLIMRIFDMRGLILGRQKSILLCTYPGPHLRSLGSMTNVSERLCVQDIAHNLNHYTRTT
jgi:hypothetical protein